MMFGYIQNWGLIGLEIWADIDRMVGSANERRLSTGIGRQE